MGRRRIEMEIVKDTGSRQVTFSKRRAGLFKKANELATLCAAQVCIIVFSPGGKPFSFGNPSVDAVAQRFLNQDDSNNPTNIPDMQAEQARRARVEKLTQQLNESLKQLHEEKKRGAMLDKQKKARGMNLYEKPVNQLTMAEAMKVMESMKELHKKIVMRRNEMEASSSLLLLSNGAPKDAAAADDIKNK